MIEKMSSSKDYSKVIAKITAPQYFIQHTNKSSFVFTTESQKIATYVQTIAPSQNMSAFTATLSGLTEDSIQQIGDFTVVKTKDLGKYIKAE